MLWVSRKISRNLSVRVCGGGIFPNPSEYFPNAENLELLFFCSTSFVDKTIRGNI